MTKLSRLTARSSIVSRTGYILGYPAASVPPPTSKRIRSPHDILVKEPRAPDLARDKRTTQDPNEEAEGNETSRVGDEPCHGRRDSPGEKDSSEDVAGPESVAEGASGKANNETNSLVELSNRKVVHTVQGVRRYWSLPRRLGSCSDPPGW